MKRELFIKIITDTILTSNNSYTLEGLFLNHPDININDYCFEILVLSINYEKFIIANYILNDIKGIRESGINENNYRNIIYNENGLAFTKKKLLKSVINHF